MKFVKHTGLALALLLAASDASAMPPAARTELSREVARAKADVPEIVRQVNDIAARAKDIDASSRKPGAPITMPFKALGPRAFGPMIDLLVFHVRDDAPPSLRLGLLEAVGAIRDARALPVFSDFLASTTDFDTMRAAAEGLGKLGTDEALNVLASYVGKPGDQERAAIAGLHDCRRERAAKLLASRLDARDIDDATARLVIHALGGAGNAWAWKTVPSAQQSEATSTRAIAARALVRAFVRFGATEVREAAAKAILVVDDPSTPSLIADAKRTANADLQSALTSLEQRLAKNPAR